MVRRHEEIAAVRKDFQPCLVVILRRVVRHASGPVLVVREAEQ